MEVFSSQVHGRASIWESFEGRQAVWIRGANSMLFIKWNQIATNWNKLESVNMILMTVLSRLLDGILLMLLMFLMFGFYDTRVSFWSKIYRKLLGEAFLKMSRNSNACPKYLKLLKNALKLLSQLLDFNGICYEIVIFIYELNQLF